MPYYSTKIDDFENSRFEKFDSQRLPRILGLESDLNNGGGDEGSARGGVS